MKCICSNAAKASAVTSLQGPVSCSPPQLLFMNSIYIFTMGTRDALVYFTKSQTTLLVLLFKGYVTEIGGVTNV